MDKEPLLHQQQNDQDDDLLDDASSVDSVYQQQQNGDDLDEEVDSQEDLLSEAQQMTKDTQDGEFTDEDLISTYQDEHTSVSTTHDGESLDDSESYAGLRDQQLPSSYADLLGQKNNKSYHSMYDTDESDPEYSDTDTFSMDNKQYEESFLLDQQKKVAFDYRRQEDHEQALKSMYSYMRDVKKRRKVTKKVRGGFARIMRSISEWILSPDKFWKDIIYALLYYFQLAGLIWIIPYAFPQNVYTFTQWTVYFNLDFVSHRTTHSNLIQWGLNNDPFYPYYLTPWLIIPPLIFTMWLFLPWVKNFPIIRKCFYEVDRVTFTLLRIMYLPFLIHTYAYGFCGGAGQSAFQCQAFCPEIFGWCLTRSVPAFLGTVYYGVGVPLAFCWQARKMIVYARNTKHMNYLGNVEVEKVLRISNNYVLFRLHMISSYTRLGSYYIFIKEAVQKATLVIIWASLDGLDYEGELSWRSQIAISSFGFAVMIVPLIIEIVWRPYRNLSYFFIVQMLGYIHVFNVMLGWFLALDVRSPFLLPSQITILILMVNATVLAVLLGMMTFMFLMRVKWPINDRVVRELETKYSHYLKSIRNGYMLYAHALTTNPSFVRCDMLFYHKEYMQKLYQEAVMENNPLEETIEDCILKLEEEYYSNQKLSILPHAALEHWLPSLRRSMDRRQTEMILIPPRKRIFLMKILALRRIMGNQPLKRFAIGEKLPESESESETGDASKSDASFDLSSMDKLQAFLAQYQISMEDDDDDEDDNHNSEEEGDDIDRLLDAASNDDDETPHNSGTDNDDNQQDTNREQENDNNVDDDDNDDSGDDLLDMDDS